MSGVLIHSYRFGFNGQEKDDEIFNVTGSSYTAEFWQYDSRLGRRWNIDPVVKPWESSYAAFRNNPIWYADPSGLDGEQTGDERTNDNGDTEVYVEGQGWTGDAEVCGNCPDNYVEKLPEEPTVLYKISSYFRNLDVKMTGGGDFVDFHGVTLTGDDAEKTNNAAIQSPNIDGQIDMQDVIDYTGATNTANGFKNLPKADREKIQETFKTATDLYGRTDALLNGGNVEDVQSQSEKQANNAMKIPKLSSESELDSIFNVIKPDSVGAATATEVDESNKTFKQIFYKNGKANTYYHK